MAALTKMVGFVQTNDPEKAKAFYSDALGFRLKADDGFALVYDANGTTIRVGKARNFTPAVGTVLGWEVEDIYAAIDELTARGVRFEQFKLDFMKQDEHGVWTPPSGDKVAWFKDPDGNVLSISQHSALP
jgi:catechol 2,3-dioxygenase-like lactoylglutathione lyase family enzyme